MDLEIKSVTSITKFNVKEQNIYGKLSWEDNQYDLFRIKLFDGRNTWSGRFSKEFAENCRSLLDETEEEYKTNVKLGLSGPQDKFSYDFVVFPEDSDTARFTWKKVFEDGTVLAHGSVPVHLDDVSESKDTLIDFLINDNKELTEVIETYIRRNDALTENLDKCKRELEQFVNMKTQLETNLFGKFIQLLNEKKRRVQLLEGHVQMLEYE